MATNRVATRSIDEESKRKRESLSSISENDTSVNDGCSTSSKQRKKKAKGNRNNDLSVNDENEKEKAESGIQNELITELRAQMSNINEKLKGLNSKMIQVTCKLEKVMEKGDPSIEAMITEMIDRMKEGVLNSFVNNIEVLERKLFDREQKCDKMKQKVKTIEEQLETQKSNNEDLKTELKALKDDRKKFENDTEQYNRRNNIRIVGMNENGRRESAYETAHSVIALLNNKNICQLSLKDIDYAHRLPNAKMNSPGTIIVKLVSRYAKYHIMKCKGKLKGTGIFINDDLTKLNNEVLMSVKKKNDGKIQEVWYNNGKILYKDMENEIHRVEYKDYTTWLEMPWPERSQI